MYLAKLTSGSKLGKKSSIISKPDANNGNKKNPIQKHHQFLKVQPIQNSIDKLFKDAIIYGDLNLSSKGLKEFPKISNLHNLIDTINCDLSKNQLIELPKEICIFIVLETLTLYSNNIKSIPDNVCNLKSLKLLDLSCNSLTYLPAAVCSLKTLEVLNVSNNKLVSLPEEINELEKLIQLDVSCNEITHLPVQIGEMKSLRSLNVRRNLLVELPKEISKCKLVNFDCSFNRLTKLPLCFREIITLIDLNVDNNPLELPPSSLCAKGLLHIMKYLLNETIKEEKKQGILSENEINFQYRGSILYQSSRKSSITNSNKSIKDETTNHINSFLNDISDINLNGCEENLNEKERIQTRELSRKMHEEQLAILEKQRQEIQKISNQLTNKDGSKTTVRRLPNDTYYHTKNESLINLNSQKKYLENRSYKSLSNLETNTSENFIIKNSNLDELYNNNNENNNENKNGFQNFIINEFIKYDHYKDNEQKNGTQDIQNIQNYNNKNNAYDYFDGNVAWSANSTPNKIPNHNLTVEPFKNEFINEIDVKNSVYTIRRNLYHAQEEYKQVEFLKMFVETKLKITLPDDVGNALSDGVVLCHLMNQLFPRAIQIIHVPSLAVPKLSMAKSRKNVESFIEACHKFGLSPNDICCAQDIIESKNTHKVARTIMMILKYNQEIQYQNRPQQTINNQQQQPQQQTAV